MRILLILLLLTVNANAALTVGNVPRVKTGGSSPALENGSITDNGNVGIGTTTPGQALDVYSTVDGTGIRVINSVQSPAVNLTTKYNNAGARNWDIITNNFLGGDLAIRRGASQGAAPTLSSFIMSSSGNVGVGGTATPNNPFVVTNAGGAGFEFTPSNGNLFTYNRSSVAYAPINIGGSTVDFNIAGPTKMKIEASGNVGIGTTGPASLLNLKTTSTGAVIIQADSDNSSESDVGQLRMSQDGIVSTANFEMDANNDLVLGANSTTAPNIYIGTRSDGTSFIGATDAKITILNGGNVGIGTVGPTQLFEVSNTGFASMRVFPRVNTVASSGTPSINVDITDVFTITALATAITSMTSGLSGTPVNGQKLIIRILDNGTAHGITWGASFASRGATLPTTTVLGKYMYCGFIYNSTASVWDLVALSQET